MTDKKKRKGKGSISEDDTVSLLQRYGATTIFTLLQEIAQSADVKIDWERIVKRSSTGISNPREYQLLWHHLAYRERLSENIDGAEPMDDDSDLEFEVENVPAVSAEVASQAAAFAKGLLPASFSSESGPKNDSAVESHSALMISTGPTAEGFEGNEMIGVGSANRKREAEGSEGNETAGAGSDSKKRKLWTKEEDTELHAAVGKFGEGNWVNILKGDFKLDRSPAQLYRRWGILKKRQSNSIIGTSKSQSEALDAARFALNSALKMPPARSFSVKNAGAVQSTAPSNVSTLSSMVYEALSRPSPPQNPKSLQEPSNLLQETPSQVAPENGNVIPSNKPHITPKTTPSQAAPENGNAIHLNNPQSSPNTPQTTTSSLIKAAAVAAGGRIVAPAAAASLFQAVQSRNVVHIRAGGSQLTSIANKGWQQSRPLNPQPFVMPPSCQISLKMLDGSTVLSNRKQNNSNFEGKSSATGVKQISISPGNAEKVSGNETSASNAVGGLPSRVPDGGDKTELDG